MSNSVQISKIEIKIGEKVFSLTMEEARELKTHLNQLFYDDSGRYFWPIFIPYPIYKEISPASKPYWEVTCKNNTLNLTNNYETT